jgi:hypothetical protein
LGHTQHDTMGACASGPQHEQLGKRGLPPKHGELPKGKPRGNAAATGRRSNELYDARISSSGPREEAGLKT